MIQSNRRAGGLIVAMLLVAMGLFLAGIFRPFTSVTKLWLFENQVSVFHGLITLWRGSELFLFLILFVFTVSFPLVKIGSLLVLWLRPGLSGEGALKMFGFVSHLGKWSMLDVFIVAILVLTVRSGGIASIKVQDGFFFFFAAVMLTQFATLWTGKAARHLEAKPG